MPPSCATSTLDPGPLAPSPASVAPPLFLPYPPRSKPPEQNQMLSPLRLLRLASTCLRTAPITPLSRASSPAGPPPTTNLARTPHVTVSSTTNTAMSTLGPPPLNLLVRCHAGLCLLDPTAALGPIALDPVHPAGPYHRTPAVGAPPDPQLGPGALHDSGVGNPHGFGLGPHGSDSRVPRPPASHPEPRRYRSTTLPPAGVTTRMRRKSPATRRRTLAPTLTVASKRRLGRRRRKTSMATPMTPLRTSMTLSIPNSQFRRSSSTTSFSFRTKPLSITTILTSSGTSWTQRTSSGGLIGAATPANPSGGAQKSNASSDKPLG